MGTFDYTTKVVDCSGTTIKVLSDNFCPNIPSGSQNLEAGTPTNLSQACAGANYKNNWYGYVIGGIAYSTVTDSTGTYTQAGMTANWRGLGTNLGTLGLKVGTTYTASVNAYSANAGTGTSLSAYIMMYDSSYTRITSVTLPIYNPINATWITASSVRITPSSPNNIPTTVQRYYMAFTWTQDLQDLVDSGSYVLLNFQVVSIVSGDTIYQYAPKLEEGFNTATTWSDTTLATKFYYAPILCMPLTSSSSENNGYRESSELTITTNALTYDDTESPTGGETWQFDGSTSRIVLTEASGSTYQTIAEVFSGQQQEFTICGWLKPSVAKRGVIFGNYTVSPTYRINLELTASNQLRFYWGGGSPDKTFTTTGAFTANTWGHFAIVYDGTKLIVYKNGIQTETYTVTLTTAEQPNVFYIGTDTRMNTTITYNGYMNDFRIYDIALTASEINRAYYGLSQGQPY